jgi:hypothetical protein
VGVVGSVDLGLGLVDDVDVVILEREEESRI